MFYVLSKTYFMNQKEVQKREGNTHLSVIILVSDTFCVRTSKWVFAEIVGQEPAVSPAPMAHDC